MDAVAFLAHIIIQANSVGVDVFVCAALHSELAAANIDPLVFQPYEKP